MASRPRDGAGDPNRSASGSAQVLTSHSSPEIHWSAHGDRPRAHTHGMEYRSGVLHVSELNLTASALRTMVRSGELRPVCRGWYATPTADPEAIRARQAGGTLTAQSLLRHYGVWLVRDGRFHVRIRPHGHSTGSACVHRLEPAVTPRDDVALALVAMAHCSTAAAVTIAIDSVLNKGLLRLEEIEAVSGQHHRLAKALRASDGRSQAGGETQMRLFLRSNQIGFQVQVYIAGVGWVDLLVGERLVIEIDGREFHLGEQFERDRERDLRLHALGYTVLRLSYRQLESDWDSVCATILSLVRSGAHRR